MATRDRSLAELDEAIRKTTKASEQADKHLQEKKRAAACSDKRKQRLEQALKKVCDDCATIPCLVALAAAEPASWMKCSVCGRGDMDIEATRLRSAVEELKSAREGRRPIPSWGRSRVERSASLVAAIKAGGSSPPGVIDRILDRSRTAAAGPAPPTKSQMLARATHLCKDAQSALAEATRLVNDCKKQKQALETEQRSLLNRLAGTKRAGDGVAVTGVKRAKGASVCSHCRGAAPTHLVAPCGHKTLCGTCAAIYAKPRSKCPVCRAPVQSVVEVFDS